MGAGQPSASAEAWDRGLQPERTALAWRRFGIAIIGVGLAMPRLTWPAIGWWGLPAGACALVVGVVVLHQSVERYRRAHTTLTTSDVPTLPSGRTPLLLVVTLLVMGVTALGAVAANLVS
ncbi:DUF202 domain-containing protein [Aestuariimicrobium soli]|uniref:DUF202 domain-containing protein n=1 Tax=Aestuariimicrobium soli TaxID=2035834 RepID=UPI003EB7F649